GLSCLWSNKNSDDASVVDNINKAAPDILMVAYGPIKQERWIYNNLPKLNIKLAIGVGGTFDYIAGKKSSPPNFIRYSGLEWLWRLITQPYRLGRIINATFGLASETMLYKICQHLPYRKNVAAVIIKNGNQIFIAKRNPENPKNYTRKKETYLNYWQLPQGGRDNEDIVSAAKREAQEETGITNLKLIKISDQTNKYDFHPSWKRLFDTEYRFKGQNQNIVYFEFLGNDAEIKIDTLETIDWRWVNIGELQKAVHPERQALAKIVLKDLG
ncbi:MAG: WecB/TagA/CpsF family glycosyltransferase, partial [Candidatus Paceibacterales bacterium]